jgi:hypothetical protein
MRAVNVNWKTSQVGKAGLPPLMFEPAHIDVEEGGGKAPSQP